MNTGEQQISNYQAETAHRNLRRTIFGIACAATFVAAFYGVENWRGRRIWHRVQSDLIAKGAPMDWAGFIPGPVPDDQNVFKAPCIQNWFVKGAAGGLTERLASAPVKHSPAVTGLVHIAELRLVTPGSGSADVIRLSDPTNASRRLETVLRGALGPALSGAQGILLCSRPLNQLQVARVDIEGEPALSAAGLQALLPQKQETLGGTEFKIQASSTNSFTVVMDAPRSWCTAVDYLAATARNETEFEMVREALKRPYARMDGDYRTPFENPIPNFVALRQLAQVLAQRAQCYLLLGQGEPAARDLVLVRQMCRLLEAEPTGKPMTLVAAMINVAISGLYTAVVQDGFRLGVWQEPQLRQLQEESARIDLLPYVYSAFEAERAAVCHLLGTMDRGELGNIFNGVGNPKASLWERLTKEPSSLLILLIPRGWLDQNRTTVAVFEQQMLDTMDLTNRIVLPTRCKKLWREVSARFSRFSVKTFLATLAIPNAVRANETMARYQTLAYEAAIACALERYRLVKGQYPDRLEALAPEFITRLPRDIIGGKSLQYRLSADGGYLLYSVGWNEQDDGGSSSEKTGEGDWVWAQPPRL